MNDKTKIHFLKYPLIFILILSFSACKDDEQSNIPLVGVNITFRIDDPAYSNLQTVGGWEYLTGGSRGIIVFRSGQDQFQAYDRHCPFRPSETCALVSVDANNITATDNCCSSSFSLQDGSVTSPPARQPLQAYSTSFDGINVNIYN
jgi:nitrite reductase/ring-hydroxylating ferredoxin subunit